MKKQIFVTIAEFLENGGELVKGRQLFEHNLYTKEIVLAGKYTTVIDDYYYFHNEAANKENEDGADYLYVQIDCTPIYK